KLTAGRREGSRQGLYSKEKVAFQMGRGAWVGDLAWRAGMLIPQTHTNYFPFFKELPVDPAQGGASWSAFFEQTIPPLAKIHWGLVLYTLIGTVVIVGASNAVNLTDGLDGLASGCMSIVSGVFLVLTLIAATRGLADYLYLPAVPHSGQMAVILGATVG